MPMFHNTIIHADCLHILPKLPAESVQFILTDPPYLVRYKARDGRTVPNDDNDRMSSGYRTASLNVGVIGLGRMGSLYARNLAQRVTNARLVAVADQKADLREQFAGELSGVKVYASHLDLLQDKDVEAVVIVTSTSTHKQVVMDAADCGKAIFCEKPMSLSLADA